MLKSLKSDPNLFDQELKLQSNKELKVQDGRN